VLGLGGEQVTEMGVDTTAGSGTTTLAWQHTNVFAGGKLLGTYDKDGLHFYFDDPLGTRRAQTDYAGHLEQTCQSLPYGDHVTNCIINPPTEHFFTGKERDTESQLDYFGARYYASSMGRFMSPDPLYIEMHRLVDPQQLNLYAYGRNNPLTITDPTGLDITCGGTRCADYLSGLQKDVSFKVDYDKNGKVETVGDIDKKSLSKSDKAFLSAIDDSKHHVTINAIGGAGDASTFFGSSQGSTHTINFDQAALLDGSKNAGGMTSASLVGHETLEGYDESKGYSMADGHNWAASLGFPGMSPMAGGTFSLQNGMVIGMTANFQIQGTSTVESIGMRFVTPIPKADFMKNAQSAHPTQSPVYPVSVEKK
jgi:RHS repeat-associated protein